MARVNIEDSLYRDNRFIELYIKLGSLETALGALIRVWSVAQKFYLLDDRRIPIEEWKKQKLNDSVIDVGLAENVNGRVRVAGSDEQFKWLAQRVDAGRKGGQSKGKQSKLPDDIAIQRESARAALNAAVNRGVVEKPSSCTQCGKTGVVIEGHHDDYSKPLEVFWVCKDCHTEVHRAIRTSTAEQSPPPAKRKQAVAKQPQAEAKPSSLPPSLALAPTHHSLKKEESISSKSSAPPGDARAKIAYFADQWKAKYKANYTVIPKEAGLLTRSFKEIGFEKFISLVDAYFQMHEAVFLSKRHDITSLVMNVPKVSHFAQTGVKVTRHDVQQIELREHNTNVFSKLAKERSHES